MKFLILVIVTTWTMGPGTPPQVIVVESPEDAAVCIYQEIREGTVGIDKHEYELYELDTRTMQGRKLRIPQIRFKR